MSFLKETGTDWRERRYRKLCMSQNGKVRLDQKQKRSVMSGRGVRHRCSSSHILFSPYSQHLTKQALNGFGNFKIRGKVICNTKYTNYLVVLAKEETMAHSMINKLNEIESCACGKN